MKKKIALVFGGRSAEHEVSIKSARNIYKAIDTQLFTPILIGVSKEGSWYHFENDSVFEMPALTDNNLNPDQAICLLSHNEKPHMLLLKNGEKVSLDCAFPIIHGTMGEDGTLQGYFKILNIPFVGCSVLSSAVGMDKDYMKRLLTEAQIPNSRYVVLTRSQPLSYAQITEKLGSPFFIKPANAGSSVGVHKVKDATSFTTLLADSFLYDHKVIAEEFIEGREVECAVLGLNQNPKASLPGELIVKHEFYSYEAKYLDAQGAEIVIPANLTTEQIQAVQTLAKQTYTALGCDGLTRVDFFIRKNGQVYVNEINTLPGFTQISMYPKMWEASGISYSQLISDLIHLAFEKHQHDNSLKMSF
ncbi:D-alanine--D-alanine ligase family protein [Pseudobdellovibrio exovorus]|uniref:D-alanine--D-alanine ligase n=1 Tax=Pseudobdellovibrio exovorus JSS TaxID=1184267 RepID=M4VA78_9BACT|nr:D-alanine--D-alanine ligase family protein [Pseudobdellovibrio exovorus]AGH96312.1 D-alanine-D-alanine ligase [Pseudobdellovibrio exovorus JSS]